MSHRARKGRLGESNTDMPGADMAKHTGLRARLHRTRAILAGVSNASTRHETTTYAAAVSFLAIFGVLSSLSAFVAFYGLTVSADHIAKTFRSLTGFVPADTILAMIGQMNSVAEQPVHTLVSAGVFSAVVALWCAQQGMSTLMVAFNRAYDVRTPHGPLAHLIKSALISLQVVIGLLLTAGFAIGTPVIATSAGGHHWALEVARDGGMIVGGFILYAGLMAVYRWVPDRAPPAWDGVRAGAALVIGFWAAASTLFSVFLSFWNSYTAMYGSLSAVLIFVTLTYVAVISVLLGAELNAQIERRHEAVETGHNGDESSRPE